jgi:hypothetical protein
MVTIYLFFLTFIVTIFFIVANLVRAGRLAKHLNYEGGALQLLNVTQYQVMSFGKLDYDLPDEKSKALYLMLKSMIMKTYMCLLPLLLITFVANFIES